LSIPNLFGTGSTSGVEATALIRVPDANKKRPPSQRHLCRTASKLCCSFCLGLTSRENAQKEASSANKIFGIHTHWLLPKAVNTSTPARFALRRPQEFLDVGFEKPVADIAEQLLPAVIHQEGRAAFDTVPLA
jgi:hypothetical protein